MDDQRLSSARSQIDSLHVPPTPGHSSALGSQRPRSASATPFIRTLNSPSHNSSFRLRFDNSEELSSSDEVSSSEDENQAPTISYSQMLPRSSFDDAISIHGPAFTNADEGDIGIETRSLRFGSRQSLSSHSSNSLHLPDPDYRRGSTVTFIRSVPRNSASSITPLHHATLEDESQEDDGIGWISKEDMPPINPNFEKRALGALNSAMEILKDIKFDDDFDEEEEAEDDKKRSCFDKLKSNIKLPAALTAAKPSKKLLQAQKVGLKMVKKLLFPAFPKFLRDLWVGVELTASIVQFVLAVNSTDFESNLAFSISFIVLTIIGFLLGLMDSWTYFYTMGSCRECYEQIKKRREGGIEKLNEAAGNKKTDLAEEGGSGGGKAKGKLIKVKEFLEEAFEILRTVLSELILYPLIMFDLFELLGGDFDLSSSDNQIGFSLFLLGSIFLVLSVYIVRFMILSTTILQLNRMPVSCLSGQDHIMIITRFLIHVFIQVFVHMLCIIAVGVKIKQENADNDTDFYLASPFLFYVMAAGWVIPIFGIISYFVIKYYWFHEFSAGLFLDMISMLQTQGFAEAVFHSKASELAEESTKKFVSKVNTLDTLEKKEKEQIEAKKALEAQKSSREFMKKIDFANTRDEYEKRQSEVTFFYKFLYPMKVPLFTLYGIFYDALILSFCACLLLTTDGQGGYRVSAFDGGSISITLFVTIVFLVIGNLNVLIAINIWISTIIVGFLLIVLLLIAMLVCLPLLPCIAYVIHKKRKKIPQYAWQLSEQLSKKSFN